MGWFTEESRHDEEKLHEGYVIGLVPIKDAQDRWRELREGDSYSGTVERVKIGCECGWRSRVFLARPAEKYLL